MAANFNIEFDKAQLAALQRKLGRELYDKAIGRALTTMAYQYEGVAKSLTPVGKVRGGNLRRTIQSDVRHADRMPNPESRVESRAVYANWIETGTFETKPDVVMTSMPGGYRMFEQAKDAASRDASKHLSGAAKAIENQWAKAP